MLVSELKHDGFRELSMPLQEGRFWAQWNEEDYVDSLRTMFAACLWLLHPPVLARIKSNAITDLSDAKRGQGEVSRNLKNIN